MKKLFDVILNLIGAATTLAITTVVIIIIAIALLVTKPWAEDVETLPPEATQTIEAETFNLTFGEVESELKAAGDLITSEYAYTNCVEDEDFKNLFGIKVPFTTDEVVFTYDGVIHFGLEMDKINGSVDNENKVITLKLPAIQIKSHDVDEKSYVFKYEKNSIFNAIDIEETIEKLGELEAKKEASVMADQQIMSGVKEDTEECITKFLSKTSLAKEYDVKFEWAE